MSIHIGRRGAALVAALLGLYALGLHGHLIVGPDQAQFVVLGKALADGSGYRQIQVAQEPLFTRMPPALPAGFAVAEAAGAPGLWAHHALVALLGLVAIVLLHHLAAPVVGPRAALLVALLTGVNAVYYSFAHQTLSEAPYTTASLLTLLLLRRVRLAPEPRWIALAVLAAAVATYVRTVGVVLVPAGALALAAGGGPLAPRLLRASAFALGVALLVAPWMLYVLGPSDEMRNYSYFDLLSDDDGAWAVGVADRLAANALHYLAALGDLAFVVGKIQRVLPLPAIVATVAGGLAASLAGAGFAARGWGAARAPVGAYVAAYGAVVLAWFPFGSRMLAPLLPLLLLGAWRGAQLLGRRWPGAAPALRALGATYVAVNLLAVGHLLLAGDGRSHRGTLVGAGLPASAFFVGPHRDLWRAAEWAGARTERGDLVVSRHNQLVFLAAERQTLPLSEASLRHPRAALVIVDGLPGPAAEVRLLERLRRAPPPPWHAVADLGSARVLGRGVRRAPAAAGPPAGGSRLPAPPGAP